MINQRKFQASVIILAASFQFLESQQAFCQDNGAFHLTTDENPMSLELVNRKKSKQRYLSIGQMLCFKLATAPGFEKGRITEITDSTISLEKPTGGSVTVNQRDVTGIRFRKIRAGGIVLLALGVIQLGSSTGPVPHDNSGTEGVLHTVGIVIGSAFVVGGASLLILAKGKRVKLGNAWTLHSTSAVVPGNMLTVIMNNGDRYTIKVDRITAAEIFGKDVKATAYQEGQQQHVSRKLAFKDIKECSRIAGK